MFEYTLLNPDVDENGDKPRLVEISRDLCSDAVIELGRLDMRFTHFEAKQPIDFRDLRNQYEICLQIIDAIISFAFRNRIELPRNINLRSTDFDSILRIIEEYYLKKGPSQLRSSLGSILLNGLKEAGENNSKASMDAQLVLSVKLMSQIVNRTIDLFRTLTEKKFSPAKS